VNGHIERFNSTDLLGTSAVLCFFEDREGDLWLGTESNGVSVLRAPKFTMHGGSDAAVQCVFEDHAGVVWLGTNGQGLERISDTDTHRYTTGDGLASNVVFSLAEASDGTLLVGTPDGLNLLKDNQVRVLTSADGLPDDFVRSLLGNRDGSIWIGTRRGLSVWRGGHVQTYTRADGLGSDLVGALLRSRDGDLWIGTLEGLTRFASGKFKSYTVADGLSSNIITSLYEDSAGALWLGTEDGGLNRFAQGQIASFPAGLGLPRAIYGIAEDYHGQLWMASNNGIFRASRSELNDFAERRTKAVTVVPYGTSDGLSISEISGSGHPAEWKAQDGTLWFATLKGAAALSRQDNCLNRVPPPAAVEGIAVDGLFYSPGDLREVQPGHARLVFEYAGLSFVAPQKVRFKYKLSGFDRDWVDAGTQRTAFYTNLPPGYYSFEVMARNNDGYWSAAPASVGFRMLPHFFQTFWFSGLVIASLGFAAYGVYLWRISEIEGRFRAVLAERNLIAREIHDSLAQGFIGVSVQLEIVSRLLTTSLDSAQDHLQQARILVRESLTEARRAIWELRSPHDEGADLAARLSNIAKQVASNSGLKIQIDVRGAYRPVGSQLEEELLKITKEALTNVVRHADARKVSIDLVFEPKKLRMTIKDDGRGFSPDQYSGAHEGHFGMKGMRERAAQVSATLVVASEVGQGTEVSLEAPVH
jgi:signal transduction histidine kinase/ligand-binding sensor domain-containing protein